MPEGPSKIQTVNSVFNFALLSINGVCPLEENVHLTGYLLIELIANVDIWKTDFWATVVKLWSAFNTHFQWLR